MQKKSVSMNKQSEAKKGNASASTKQSCSLAGKSSSARDTTEHEESGVKKGRRARIAELARIPNSSITADQREELRNLFRDDPALRSKLAAIPAEARRLAMEAMATPAAYVEAMVTEMEILGEELGTNDPRPAVRLLAAHAVTCWIKLQAAETRSARLTKNPHQMKEGDYLNRGENCAQRRFLQAIEMLERVKRIGNGPSVVVNVAEKQINLCSG